MHRRIPLLIFSALLLLAPAIAGAAVSSTPLNSVPKGLASIGEENPIEAAFLEGVASYEAGDYPTAVRAWRTPAERGHAGAQFTLGIAYATGKGVSVDLNRAVSWWEAAAAQGYAPAQFNLGMLYARGNGVDKDLTKARLWWQRAANSGDHSAQFHLGALAATGEGGVKSYEEAARWWRLAAAQGNEQAARGLHILKSHGALPDETK